MNDKLFNLCVILFPLFGSIGGLFHYAIAVYFIEKSESVYTIYPKWFKITFVLNIIITAISGLTILILYKP